MARHLTLTAFLVVLICIVTPASVAGEGEEDGGFDPTFDEDFSEGAKKERMKACWLQSMAHLSNNQVKAEEMASEMVAQGEEFTKKAQAVNAIFTQWMFSCYIDINSELVSGTLAAESNLEDVAAPALFGKGHLFDEATQDQQRLVVETLEARTKENREKKAKVNAREQELKEKEDSVTQKVAEAQGRLKDQLDRAHAAGILSAKEVNEKMAELELDSPKPLVFEFSFDDALQVQESQEMLKAKLWKKGFDMDDIEKPEVEAKDDRGEWTSVGRDARQGFPLVLKFTFHVTATQASLAGERKAKRRATSGEPASAEPSEPTSAEAKPSETASETFSFDGYFGVAAIGGVFALASVGYLLSGGKTSKQKQQQKSGQQAKKKVASRKQA